MGVDEGDSIGVSYIFLLVSGHENLYKENVRRFPSDAILTSLSLCFIMADIFLDP